jgi:hypothetical protein
MPEIFDSGVSSVVRRAVIIGNGVPGAENQCIGLVRALGLTKTNTHSIFVSYHLLYLFLVFTAIFDGCYFCFIHLLYIQLFSYVYFATVQKVQSSEIDLGSIYCFLYETVSSISSRVLGFML